MQACEDVPLQLTSAALNPSSDGTYSYDVLGFLIPHEMIRREFSRGEIEYRLHPTYLENHCLCRMVSRFFGPSSSSPSPC
jgi:hypothetical protein